MPESGFVTLLVMLLLTVFFLYGLEGYENANGLNRMARREAQSRQAVHAAEGGIEWAKSQLQKDPSWQGGEYLLGERRVVVTAEQSEGGYLVISSAHAGMAERDIKVLMKMNAGHWTVLRYQELHL